ncbi:Asp-tRNAAsn/Glu-tRNAGln amidotransferase A subunit [Klenkia soli]|uniref:Asp-tRNAAsn/Glu-tRNAGln amidotransferase A subunit n=1 Tax=Klenkia soli TaxID=1052260 RepID=A0A1H0KIG9_9ACTN|nr:AtzH-like domain-containing protein [Klenkia soli]SDO55570.1 Asp-tRNAAsn/Glu-tRNAGln amidotransferase A subunit [Klenkia soli]
MTIADVGGWDVEDEVRAAVGRYESALAADDLAELDALFAPGDTTLRADAGGVLVSHGAISDYRRGRGGAPARTVTALHVVVHTGDLATAVAETLRPDGTRGLQTQVWERGAVGWQVRVAHVSSGPAPTTRTAADASCERADPATWRVVGSPLVAPSSGGPLDGVSIAVKDLVDVAGHPVGAGNPVRLAQAVPAGAHAPVLADLLAAGAHVRGIARTDELAYSLSGTNVHHGSPANPWGAGLVVGGSTNGPASAVARGQADLGLGTDTAGSIRVPASYCGLHGLRPTHGVLSLDGVLPLAPSFDTVGWLTRDAGLLHRVASELLPAATPITALVLASDLVALADEAVASALSAAAAELAAASGLALSRQALVTPEEHARWFTAFRTVQGAQAWAAHGAWITANPGVLGPGIAQRFVDGSKVGSDDLVEAAAVLAEGRAALRARLPGGTAVLLPAASSTAPLVGATAERKATYRAATLRLTCLAGVGGLPSAVAPAALVDGLPVGLALLGAAGGDTALTGLLAAWDRRLAPPS